MNGHRTRVDSIREITDDDQKRVLEIYKKGIALRIATFETEVPDWEKWNAKYLHHSRILYSEKETVLGWAALSPVSNRKVYEGVAEVSIYVDPMHTGKGIGNILLEELVERSEKNGIWTLFSSIFPENVSSVRIHRKNGFREIGYREKIAKLDGLWRDTVIYERRSTVVGVEETENTPRNRDAGGTQP